MENTIHDIQILLEDISSESDKRFIPMLSDKRKGVQKLIEVWRKKREREANERDHFIEMSQYEVSLRSQGLQWIAGIDEVGRGPLAGPVVAAAVILPDHFFLSGLDDSKKLSEAKRDQFYDYLLKHALAIGIGIVESKVIDEINIYEATKKAMLTAIFNLSIKPEHLLIDAMKLPTDIKQTSIIKGDARSISIAAASVIAKVTRDRMMKKLGEKYPNYGFEKHMGYGTKDHLAALETYGPLPVHRKSFAPVKNL